MDSIDNFGVLLPTRGVLVYSEGGRPRVELNWQMAETVERLGYDSVWVGDSITSKPRLEPLTIMSAIAARTQRVKIGTAVKLTALRHPVHLAHSLATIDNVSNGRVILGAGAGRGDNQMYIDEHESVGIPVNERADRMEEGIRILRALWSEEDVTYEGDYYPLKNVTLEPQPLQDPLPIWISSNWVRRGLRRVAEMGDAWITNVPSVELFERCWDRVQENAASGGRDASTMARALYISVNLNEEDEALAEGDRFMQAYYSRPYEAVSKQLLCVFGPPEKCAEAIRSYREAGVTYFIVRFASPNQQEQLDRFTSQVLPHVS
ncbi:MAG: LLM class flavin-dependent oxidoreductase [Chloroflexota bacterium]|nr:LLM class flavin-dependent oxidoreductase [Chloroflexota bacterium]